MKGYKRLTDREKQIEEIAQDIASNCPDMVDDCCGSKHCYVCIAEGLAKEGYRKIPKDSMVLTKEEVDRITKELAGQFGIVLFDEKGDEER